MRKNNTKKAGKLIFLLGLTLMISACGKDSSAVLTKDGTAVPSATESEQQAGDQDAKKTEEGKQEDAASKTDSSSGTVQGEGDPEDVESSSVPETDSTGEGDPEDFDSESIPAGQEQNPAEGEQPPAEQGEGDPEDFESESVPEADTSRGNTDSPVDIVVYICGEVASPGVVKLKENARIYEAVRAAGGLKKTASLEAVNQAAALEDGMMIRIPSKKELKRARKNGTELIIISRAADTVSVSGNHGAGAGTTGGSAGASNAGAVGGSVGAGTTGGGTGTSDAGTTGGSAGADGKININTADLTGLKQIPGIGDAKAAAIMEYREANGKFQSIEEITKVNGIKKGTFNKIKEYITV